MLVIRQKGESQNGYFKKTKHAKFSESEHFSPPDMLTYVRVSGGMKCSFLGKFGVLCFLETPVLRFALLPYYRRSVIYAHKESFSAWDKREVLFPLTTLLIVISKKTLHTNIKQINNGHISKTISNK